jgi:uncharacterized protein (DUF885 family)
MTPEAIHELGLKEVARFQLKWKNKTQVGFKGTMSFF